MNINEAYDSWSENYDTNENRTRDLEAIAIREVLKDIKVGSAIELGCGTGKNTSFLASISKELTAVDFSEKMLNIAKNKIDIEYVTFLTADLTKDWNFENQQFQLATFSLVLEHFKDLNIIFQKLDKVVKTNGFVYIGELHPFKQYTGSKARFETENGTTILDCYTHHITDYINAGSLNGFTLINLKEFFDDNDITQIPRILTILFQKQST